MGETTGCGLCRHWDLRPILDMGMQPLPERYGSDAKYPLVLVECQGCTLVQLSYIPPPREVFAEDHSYSSGNTRALVEHFFSLAAALRPLLTAGDLLCDIGANDGSLLEAVREEVPGVRLLGVEPTGQAAKCAARNIEVSREFFTAETGRRLASVHGPAKVITACNVMAHVPDLHSFAEGMARLLADDGVAVIECHDAASILDGLQLDAAYHEHAYYHSVTTISRLLQMHGLVVSGTEKIPTHGGSFRVWARKQQTAGLAARAAAAAGALRVMLDGAVQEGPVYGIGATTRATPLIHYAQIAEYIACVCEVPGSDKIGLTMPASSIPVVDEAKLIADQPPTVLLLAWHWAASIVPALRRKGYEGRVIVPLPVPKVIDG